PFVIRFRPDQNQWNIVEETYGAKGQNLVGKLVEKERFNNEDQMVEYELEDDSQEIEVPDNVELDIDGTDVTMLVPDDVLFDYDNEGSTSYNMDLSEDRADAVKEYFDKQLKSDDITFDTKGYADSKPISSNDSESGRAKNRRVEILINLK